MTAIIYGEQSYQRTSTLDTIRISRTLPDTDRFPTYPTLVNETLIAGNKEKSIAYYNTIDPTGALVALAYFESLIDSR